MTDCVLYFVKYPEPGKVKTRLARHGSSELAAAFYRALASAKHAELQATTDATLLTCFTPDNRSEDVAEWLGAGDFLPQGDGDLGERMERAFCAAFDQGCRRAVLVGSDIPGLTPAIVRHGLDALDASTVALGPARDGGYYLIGFHRDGFEPELLRNMAWSRDDVLERTVNRLSGLGLKRALTDRLPDMDTIEDLASLVTLGEGGPLRGEVLELARQLTGATPE